MILRVATQINAPLNFCWELFSEAIHISKWYSASADWFVPQVKQDFEIGGEFSYTLSAKDHSFSFDYKGYFTEIVNKQIIAYKLADGRNVQIDFKYEDNHTEIIQAFEPEKFNTPEMQIAGWQAILNNFKSYTEHHYALKFVN
ncbi:MAG: SRPBCC domain-containing protein [Cytophagales bacterium]